MVKDYAHQKSPKNPPPSRGKLFAIVFIAIAMFSPLTLFYFKHKKSIHQGAITKPTKKPAAAKSIKATTAATTQFDFYTLLPKIEVPTEANHTNPKQLVTTASAYVLQVASVQNRQDAKQLSQQLQTQGFRAFVQHYQAQTNDWYRVMVGPYFSSQQAAKMQQRLHQHKFSSILLRLNHAKPRA